MQEQQQITSNISEHSFAIKKATIILTNCCNLACLYCQIREAPKIAPGINQLYAMIEELVNSGISQINFIGGEPLLYASFKELLKKTKQLRAIVSVHTNLTLFDENNGLLFDDVDHIHTCLNGFKRVNDNIRGNGVYKKTLDAIIVLKKRKIDIVVDYIITNSNSSKKNIDHIIGLAKKIGFRVNFQPVHAHNLAGINKETLEQKGICATQNSIMETFNYIASHKLSFNHLFNSQKYILLMAEQGVIAKSSFTQAICLSECIIDINGNLFRCYQDMYRINDAPNGYKLGWYEALHALNIESKPNCLECHYSTKII